MDSTESSDGLLRVLLVVVAAVVLLPVLLMAVAMPMMGVMGGMWTGGMGPGTGGGFPLWGLGVMLVWLLVLGGVGYLLYRGVTGGDAGGGSDPALRELRVAYARGDLSDEEFERRRERLRGEE